MTFIEELKRRNVFRVGIAYAVSAWVLLQFADLVLENTEAPTWVMDVLFLFVGLGFLVALVVAWAFEITPEGIRREKDVDRSDSIPHETGRKLEYITLAAAALVVVLFVVDRFGDADEVSPPTADTASASTAQVTSGGRDEAADGTSVEGVAATSDDIVLGVAVLPFENLSIDEANAFFAGGVHEDVLSHISRINDLKVISRTSMLRIAERNLDIPEIGRQLGVTHVLEGSVRRAGDQVRVTVQLIDAATDRHLWSENYDRRLDDIFAIQSEIASSIAAQLRSELSPQERARMEEAPTSNVMAYDLYLQARELNQIWRGAQGFDDQRELLEQALAIDPDFLDAKVMLASAYGRLVWTGSDPEGIYRVKARELSEEIQENHPGSPQAAMARADYRYTVMRDYDQALRDYQALLAEDPNNTDLLQIVSSSLKRLNRADEAVPILERAMALDPENPGVHSEMVIILQLLGKTGEAMELLESNIRRFPEDETLTDDLATTYLFRLGDKDTWRAMSPNRIGTPNAQDDAGIFIMNDALQRRLAIEEFGIEPVLAGLERAREEGNEWRDIRIGIAAAEALNLAGRETASVERARKALAQLEARTVRGKLFPSVTPRITLTLNAYVACLADEPDKAAFLLGLADGLQADDASLDGLRKYARMLTQAECGALDQAWETAQTLGGDYWFSESWFTTDPIFAHYFGDLPAFQAMLESGS